VAKPTVRPKRPDIPAKPPVGRVTRNVDASTISRATVDEPKLIGLRIVVRDAELDKMFPRIRCDPQLIVNVGHQTETTTIKEKTLTPLWNTPFSFRGPDLATVNLLIRNMYPENCPDIAEGVLLVQGILKSQLRLREVEKWIMLYHDGRKVGRMRLTLVGDFEQKNLAVALVPKANKKTRPLARQQSQRAQLHTLRITVCEAHIPTLEGHPCNLLMAVGIGDDSQQTHACFNTARPQWNQELRFKVHDPETEVYFDLLEGPESDPVELGTGSLRLDAMFQKQLLGAELERWVLLQTDGTTTGRVRATFVGEFHGVEGMASPAPSKYLSSLCVTVVEAKGLTRKGDEFLSPDPLCIIQLGGVSKETHRKPMNANPVWDETFTFDVDRGTDHLTISVVDTGDRRNVLGDCMVPLDASMKNKLSAGKVDLFFPLFQKQEDGRVAEGGEIRLAFTAQWSAKSNEAPGVQGLGDQRRVKPAETRDPPIIFPAPFWKVSKDCGTNTYYSGEYRSACVNSYIGQRNSPFLQIAYAQWKERVPWQEAAEGERDFILRGGTEEPEDPNRSPRRSRYHMDTDKPFWERLHEDGERRSDRRAALQVQKELEIDPTLTFAPKINWAPGSTPSRAIATPANPEWQDRLYDNHVQRRIDRPSAGYVDPEIRKEHAALIDHCTWQPQVEGGGHTDGKEVFERLYDSAMRHNENRNKDLQAEEIKKLTFAPQTLNPSSGLSGQSAAERLYEQGVRYNELRNKAAAQQEAEVKGKFKFQPDTNH